MEQNNKFDVLPNETLLHIFSFFNKRDQGRASLVSNHFHKLSTHSSLKNLPYPDLNYSEMLPEKSKQLSVNSWRGSGMGIWSMALLSEQYFVTGAGRGWITVWDKNKDEPFKIFKQRDTELLKTIYKIIPISATQFISCGDQGEVYLWDITQNKDEDQYWDEPLKVFENEATEGEGAIYEALFLKETNLLIAGCSDNKLHIWNATTGKYLYKLEGHTQEVRFIASFSNNLLVSASSSLTADTEADYDCGIKLWSLDPNTQQRLLTTLEGHTGKITTLFKLDDNRLVTGAEDYTLRIWDIRERTCIKIINLPELQTPKCLQLISPGLLACGTSAFEESSIHLYNVQDPGFPLIESLLDHTRGVLSMVVLDNKHFASVDMIGSIKVWDIETKNCIQTTEETGNEVRVLAKLPNGYLVSACFDKSDLNIWAFPEREFEPTPIPKP